MCSSGAMVGDLVNNSVEREGWVDLELIECTSAVDHDWWWRRVCEDFKIDVKKSIVNFHFFRISFFTSVL